MRGGLRWRPGALQVLGAASLTLAAWAGWWVSEKAEEKPGVSSRELAGAGVLEAGTAGLGDATWVQSGQEPRVLSCGQPIADEPLPEPQPGQTRTDAKGRCPRPKQFPLNGACWVQTQLERESCEELNGQMFKGTCYAPIIPRGRPPTSSPEERGSRAQ